MSPHTLLSVFDFTGQWAEPYSAAGHDVVTMDLKTGQNAKDFSCQWFVENQSIENVDGMLLAPPCTHFTNPGAWTWKAKDEDGRTAEAVEIAQQALRAAEFWCPDFWALENPVGRLPKLLPVLGRPGLMFDPCDFAGWNDITADEIAWLDELRARNGEGTFTEKDVALVKRTNAYTKRTCLWGDFELPERRRIEPVKVCKQGSWTQRLGGKSEATKAARSVTPAGFAKAFAAANNWDDADKLNHRRAARYCFRLWNGATCTDGDLLACAADEFGDGLDMARLADEYARLLTLPQL